MKSLGAFIELGKGNRAMVDSEDYGVLSKYKWHMSNTGYAVRDVYKGGRSRISMHRAIISASKRIMVDHINGNRLDNRKKNLRIATREQNGQNRKLNANTTSRLKGVWYVPTMKKWRSSIQIHKKRVHLGYFATKEEAAAAYDHAAIENFGGFAATNSSLSALGAALAI